MSTCNLMIACYMGDRRTKDVHYDNDRMFFIKTQISLLTKYHHTISQITFIINEEANSIKNKSFIEDIPKKIQSSNVETIIRENKGMSYGAFSTTYDRYRQAFDYYIFLEDDYFFIKDDFDTTLIKIFNEKPKCGYLCGLYREGNTPHSKYPHAGICNGISSSNCIEAVVKRFGKLPYCETSNIYGSNEQDGQVKQSYSFIECGFQIYDLREYFKVPFDRLGIIENYFDNNKEVLFVPAKYLYENNIL